MGLTIYIPVWFDLKQAGNAVTVNVVKIYIPVWFDLKVEINSFISTAEDIYIPVWFDLKKEVDFYHDGFYLFTFQYGSI